MTLTLPPAGLHAEAAPVFGIQNTKSPWGRQSLLVGTRRGAREPWPGSLVQEPDWGVIATDFGLLL